MLLEVITLLIGSTLSTIAGVGGGGILLPIYILFLNFNVDKAIPLTIITILGNCLVRFFYLWNKFRGSYNRSSNKLRKKGNIESKI